ncbi:iron chelate uptake ABC transporter family permease subunit, partial [Kitasatospora griseola]
MTTTLEEAPTTAPAKAVRDRRPLLLAALSVALLACALLAAGTGAYRIPLGDILASLAHRAQLGGHPLDRVPESVLWNVRLPRVVLALLVGAAL